MARVVQPGGRVAILEILPVKTRGPISQAMRLYFRRVVPLLGRVLTGDQQAYTYLPDSVDAFLAVHELAGVMENAGLRMVRSRTVGMGTVGILVGEKG
jgi:demethylmenaquinone methyltransferase/2-methoxy-6-polyprenyl-1,4-benzoquinol methylase